MKALPFVMKNWLQYKWYHLLVMLGVLLITGVLTGALFIGDAVSMSLEYYGTGRLGTARWYVSAGESYFLDDLASRIETRYTLSGVGLLQDVITEAVSDRGISVPGITVYGIDADFGRIFPDTDLSFTNSDGIIINRKLADFLDVQTGDTLRLRAAAYQGGSVNNPYFRELPENLVLAVTIERILPDTGPGAFSLSVTQEIPPLIYMDKSMLQHFTGTEGLGNLLLFDKESELTGTEIQEILESVMVPGDLGLSGETSGTGLLFSHREILIPPQVEELLSSWLPEGTPVFGYFLNRAIAENAQESAGFREVPFLFALAIPGHPLTLSNELLRELSVSPGDQVNLEYYVFDDDGMLKEDSYTGIVRAGSEQQEMDNYSMYLPDFPGITGTESCSVWNPGIPVDLDAVRPADELFWNTWGASPRVILPYSLAQSLWSSPFGRLTGWYRDTGDTPDLGEFRMSLSVDKLGYRIRDIRSDLEHGTVNAVAFDQLFLGLSFFLILAVFIFTLQFLKVFLRRREPDLLLLRSLGFSLAGIRLLFLGEIICSVAAGLILGAVSAQGFNYILVRTLRTFWNPIVRTSELQPFWSIQSLLTGAGSSLVIVAGAVLFELKRVLNIPGISGKEQKIGTKKGKDAGRAGKWRYARKRIVIPVAAATCSLLYLILRLLTDPVSRIVPLDSPVLYFLSGILGIGGAVLWISFLMDRKWVIRYSGRMWFLLRNWRAQKGRNIGIILVFSFSAYLLSTLILFQKDTLEKGPGTGGFSYWVETALPVPSRNAIVQASGIGFKKRSGDIGNCLNLYGIEHPSVLGVNPAALEGRFPFERTTRPGMEDFRELLDLDLGPGTIPAVVDDTVLVWSYGKEPGDSLMFTDDFGNMLEIVIVATLKSSVFQGYLLISQDNMSDYFPSVQGNRIFLTDSQNLERSLRSFGSYSVTTFNRMNQFHSIQNNYLMIFRFLGFLALVFSCFSLSVLLILDIFSRRKHIAVMQFTGISAPSVVLLLVLEKGAAVLAAFLLGIFSALVNITPVAEASVVIGGTWYQLASALTAAFLSLGITASVTVFRMKDTASVLRME